ncbi:MAG: helix-turn-helix transcriptional regulator [Clostridia bacterium]|nr:helix-turn-helix transcriptional regulator [Clostridia bacterium]
MVADRMRYLREANNLTQAGLAKHLGITRSSVNAWELGISVPSTQYIVELARTFNVSADYLLGVNSTATLDVSGLSEDDVRLLYQIVKHMRKSHE